MGKLPFFNLMRTLLLTVIIFSLLHITQSLDANWRKTAKPNHDLDIVVMERLFGKNVMESMAQPRIVGGEESRPNSRPYQVIIYIPIDYYISYCGASLIGRRTVLSAAHCLDNVAGNLTVVLGAHDRSIEEPTQQRFDTGDIVLHPGWDRSTLLHDIAIVRLQTAAVINEYVRPILLPRNSDHDYVGNHSLVSGWGQPSDEQGSFTFVLREVQNPIISNFACNMAYFGLIDESHICMSGRFGMGTCFGDSGGPLTVNGIQIGVVSFGGYFGCETGWPPGFARTSYYLDWIAANSAPETDD